MDVLVISPHADDAELGCGGTITKLISENHNIFWIVFSIAENSFINRGPKDTLKNEFLCVIKHIGLKHEQYTIKKYSVRNFDQARQNILDDFIQIKKEFKPDLVIGPSLTDFHQDHNVVANEMVRAFKTSSSIVSYEFPWNNFNFNSQLLIKLNEFEIKNKWEMLKKYKSQLALKRSYFDKKYIYSLARVRGIQCNSQYAESFEIIRWML